MKIKDKVEKKEIRKERKRKYKEGNLRLWFKSKTNYLIRIFKIKRKEFAKEVVCILLGELLNIFSFTVCLFSVK